MAPHQPCTGPSHFRLASGNNAAPSPADLFIGYKELNGSVWSSHTPNNSVQLTFGWAGTFRPSFDMRCRHTRCRFPQNL